MNTDIKHNQITTNQYQTFGKVLKLLESATGCHSRGAEDQQRAGFLEALSNFEGLECISQCDLADVEMLHEYNCDTTTIRTAFLGVQNLIQHINICSAPLP